jgi:hypothetical protein
MDAAQKLAVAHVRAGNLRQHGDGNEGQLAHRIV